MLVVFVLFLAGRDVAYDLWLRSYFGFPGHDGHLSRALAITVFGCSFVAVASLFCVFLEGRWNHLMSRLHDSRVLWRSILMGLLCAVVYGATFTLISAIGSGLFDLIDWGLAPFITAVIALAFWPSDSTSIRPRVLLLSLCLGSLGLLGLYVAGPLRASEAGAKPGLLLLALSSPVSTAFSFSLQKWLLSDALGGLSRSEVLFVRFSPAAVLLAALSCARYGGLPEVKDPLVSLPPALALFTLPAVAVCWAIVRASLGRFAAWEFAIPALAFFGTLPHEKYESHRDWPSPALAAVVVAAVLLFEICGTKRNRS